jgi:hypothetical protein
MSFLQSWTDKRNQKKLDARKVHVSNIGWTLQLPIDFMLLSLAKARKSYDRSVNLMGTPINNSIYHSGNVEILFSSHFEKFNSLASSLSNVSKFSSDQILLSREDCKDRITRMFSRIPGSHVEKSSSAIVVGGIDFDQHSFLLRRHEKPIICLEYIYQIIGEYELSISMCYNNESVRQALVKCLQESRFT